MPCRKCKVPCNRCKNKRFVKNHRSQKILISSTIDGFCKVRVKKRGEADLYDYICTNKKEFLPAQGTDNYRSIMNKVGSSTFIFWALNKNVNTPLDSEAGWVTINLNEIVFFEPIRPNTEE